MTDTERKWGPDLDGGISELESYDDVTASGQTVVGLDQPVAKYGNGCACSLALDEETRDRIIAEHNALSAIPNPSAVGEVVRTARRAVSAAYNLDALEELRTALAALESK